MNIALWMKRLCIILLISLIALHPFPILASDGESSQTTITIMVTGGPLTASIESTISIPSATNSDQMAQFSFPITIVNAMGTGAAWNLSFKATQFAKTDAPSYQLPANALSILECTTTDVVGTAPTNTISSYPLSNTADTPIRIFDTAADTGMGSFVITPIMKIAIPIDAIPGTYTSTFIVTIAVTP
jgi:hypothetical protein